MKKLVAFLALIILSSANLQAQLKVFFVDVGQGDAIYIEFPNGKNALIDGGPSGSKINDFLKSKGVTKIDYVALTHPHSDHFRGLKKVFAEFDVKHFYDTRAENVNAVGDNNLRELAEAEPLCRTHYPEPGQELKWDPKVTVKVLNSCTEKVEIHDNDETNNCSLVLRLYYNGNGILLTGDAEASVENAMMRVFKSGLQSTILKVSHHGSRYSSTDQFLKRVAPEYAVISVGAGNSYGHPHKEALDRLYAVGAKIILTTGGTQSVTIPAPGRGVSFPARPLFNEPDVTAGQKYGDAQLAWDPAAPENAAAAAPVSADSEALNQLKEMAVTE